MNIKKERCPVCSSKLVMLWSDRNCMIQTSEFVCARFRSRSPESINHFNIGFYCNNKDQYLKQIKMRGYLVSICNDSLITIMYRDEVLMEDVKVSNEFYNSLGKIKNLKNFSILV